MRVVFAYDDGGQLLARAVTEAIDSFGYKTHLIDGSGYLDYPELALNACRYLLASGSHSAILVCGTGVGMSIAANKIDGIRAARCTDSFATERARRSNNANVLAFGGQVIGPAIARDLVNIWLSHDFDSERSVSKVEAISRIEQSRGKSSERE